MTHVAEPSLSSDSALYDSNAQLLKQILLLLLLLILNLAHVYAVFVAD